MNRRDDNSSTDDRKPRSGANAPPAKRKRRRRPSRILGIGARIALLSVIMVTLVVVAVAIVAKAVRPYVEASQLKGQLSTLNRQLAQTDEQNDAYKRRLAELQTTQGQITEARGLGYIIRGEHPVVIDGSPGALSEAPLPRPLPPSPTLMSRLRGFWQSFIGSR
jgi:cell division protein FtsL